MKATIATIATIATTIAIAMLLALLWFFATLPVAFQSYDVYKLSHHVPSAAPASVVWNGYLIDISCHRYHSPTACLEEEN